MRTRYAGANTGGGSSAYYDFLPGTLPAGVSFAAASTRTNFNASGTMVTVSTDVPRFSYRLSGGVWVPEGLLIEDSRTELLTKSEKFDDASWTKTRLQPVVANAAVAPDGTTTMDKIVEDGTASNSHFLQKSVSYTSGTVYLLGLRLKADTRNWIFLQAAGMTVPARAWFNVGAGVGALGATNGAVTSFIRALGGNIYECVMFVTADTTVTNLWVAGLTTGDNTINYNGDGTSGLYVWGAQFQAGDAATSYIPTDASTVARAADIALLTNPSALSDQVQVIKFRTPRRIAGGAANVVWQRDDGTANNREAVVYGSDGKVHVIATRGGVTQCDLDMGAVAADTDVTIAARFTTGAFAASLNGGTLVSYAGGIRPDGLTTARLGRGVSGSALNSTIRSLQTWPTASDSQLPLLAA